MEKLPVEFKKKWVSALKSGKYKQGSGYLRNVNDEFCCLGVACDLVGVEWGRVSKYNDAYCISLSGNYRMPCREDLPNDIFKVLWQDYSDFDGQVMAKLASMNDTYWPFENIANWIEDNL